MKLNFLTLTLRNFLYFLIFHEIKLSNFNTKKFFVFSYILENGNPEKYSTSNNQKCLTYFKIKFFLYLGNGNPEKIPYISENGNPEKLPCISHKLNFWAQKMKKENTLEKFLIF